MALGRVVYVLLPGDEGCDPDRLVALAGDIVDHAASAVGLGLTVGIGGVVDHLRDLPRSRVEADRVVRVVRGSDRRVATIEDVRSQVVLQELADLVAERPSLGQGPLARLRAHDRAHGAPYVETLQAFFASAGDVAAAAASLPLHPNTFRYRLRRMAEEAEVHLEDPDERLLLQLQLRLEHDAGPPTSS